MWEKSAEIGESRFSYVQAHTEFKEKKEDKKGQVFSYKRSVKLSLVPETI